MLLLQLKNCHLIFRFYPLPFPVASQSSARAVSTHALSERMKEMSERIEAMDQITQNMDREFKSSRVVSTRLIYQQNGNVSWRRRTQIKQLACPMAEWQIGHRKSSLVLSARFPVVKWRSRSVTKSAYYLNMDREFKSSRVVSTICNTLLLVCGIVTEDVPVSSLRSKRLSFHFSRGQNRKSRSSVFLCSETTRKRLLRRLAGQHRSAINHFLPDPRNSPKTLCES